MASKARNPRKFAYLSSNKVVGWTGNSRVKLFAGDMAGVFCRDKNSVTFYARGYDNYMRFTGLHTQHEVTFRLTRDANQFVRWLEKCANGVKSKN